jgi:hypothetical protein
MAQARKQNVIIVDTTGDSVLGPLKITGMRLVAGSGAAATCSVAAESTTIFASSEVAAKGAEESRMCIEVRDTLTVTLSGAGAKLYIHHA